MTEARRWGLVDLVDPANAVRRVPAIWRADTASQVVTLGAAPPCFPGAAPLPDRAPFAQASTEDGLHFVIDSDDIRHRLHLRGTADRVPLAILVAPLGDALNVAACDATRRWFAGLGSAEAAAALRPSALQHQRLSLLLRVLDASLAGAGTRAIGLDIVYPWLGSIDAAAWKSTGERRRVQRLIAEARALAASGYRRLLKA